VNISEKVRIGMRAEIIEKPFDWNDNLSEIAQEDFALIQKSLSYGVASSIGMALAKLELLEKQGCKVEPQESEERRVIKWYI
jgi:hypothetical protein